MIAKILVFKLKLDFNIRDHRCVVTSTYTPFRYNAFLCQYRKTKLNKTVNKLQEINNRQGFARRTTSY